ncbi:response regulator [Niastella caeni]|nr:response regulator [Niastella caeni]
MQKTILLVDDDEEEFYIIKMALEMTEFNYRCIWANGLDQAKIMVKEHQPDFVFIDINMPRYNGICCLKQLKQITQLQHAVFVIYSTFISEDDHQAAMELGASCCIHKPENIKILLNQLTGLFNNKAHYS